LTKESENKATSTIKATEPIKNARGKTV